MTGQSKHRVISAAAVVVISTILLAGGGADARPKERYCKWEEGITEARLGLSDTRLYRDGDPRIVAALG